jgi:hypothetical protein
MTIMQEGGCGWRLFSDLDGSWNYTGKKQLQKVKMVWFSALRLGWGRGLTHHCRKSVSVVLDVEDSTDAVGFHGKFL